TGPAAGRTGPRRGGARRARALARITGVVPAAIRHVPDGDGKAQPGKADPAAWHNFSRMPRRFATTRPAVPGAARR
ncbi:hypothetical protein ACSHWI_15960, partial [Methylococcus sp. S2T]|uniref:hypothetical protein n=1 Tax=Methylococcus sp. S2T TaxID=3438967 RepID=UPI003ED862D2